MGSSLFVSTIVVQLVLAVKQPLREIKVTPRFLMRDLIFYIIVVAYLLVILVYAGRIDMTIGFGFIALYFAYVLIVIK